MAITLFSMLAKLGIDTNDFSAGIDAAAKKAESGSSSIVGGLAKIGGPLVLGGLAAGAAAVTAVGTAAWLSANELDNAFDAIRVGTGATGVELGVLEADFRAVFKAVPGDAERAANAIAELNTRLGISGEQLQDVAKPLLEMSRMMGTDATESAAKLTRAMGDWDIQADDAALTMDKFFVASQASGAGVDELMAKVVQFGAPLRLMGFSLDESIAMFAKWEKEGVNAELVMGSLRIAAGKFAAEGLPLRESLLATFDSIKNNTDASEALADAMSVFGARAGPDMAAAIREGRFEFEDMVAILGDAEGAIMDTAAATMDWREKFDLLKQGAMVTLEPLGSAMMDVASLVITAVLPLFDKLASWFESTLTPAIEMAMPGVKDLIQAFELLFAGDPGSFFELLWTGLYQIGEAFGLTDEQMRPFLDTFEDVLQWVGTFISNHGPELKAALIAIGAILAAAIEDIKAVVGPFLEILQTWWDENGAAIIATVTGLWETVTGWFKTGTEDGKSLVDTALAFIKGLWDRYGGQIIATAEEIWYGILGHIDLVMLLIQDVIDTVSAAIAGDWGEFWVGIKNVAWTLIMMVHNQIQTVLGAIATLFGLNRDEVSGTVSTLFEGLMLTVFGGLDWIKGAIETALAFIKDWWETHGDSVMRVVDNTWDTIQTIIDTVLGVIEGITQAWTAAREGDWYAFGEALRGIVDTLWVGIQRIFSNTLDSIKTIVMTGLATLNSIFSAGWETLKTRAGETVQNLWDAFTNINWGELGTGIIKGIASGISSGAGIIADAARSAADSALQAAKGFLKIACPQPSPVFQELGLGMGLGVEKGWDEAMADMASHMPAVLGEVAVTPSFASSQGGVTQAGNQYNYNIILEEPQTRSRGSLETLVSMLEMSHG